MDIGYLFYLSLIRQCTCIFACSDMGALRLGCAKEGAEWTVQSQQVGRRFHGDSGVYHEPQLCKSKNNNVISFMKE